jgi:hypothetical protein
MGGPGNILDVRWELGARGVLRVRDEPETIVTMRGGSATETDRTGRDDG